MSENRDKPNDYTNNYSDFLAKSLDKIFDILLRESPAKKWESVKTFYLLLPNSVKIEVKPQMKSNDGTIEKMISNPVCSKEELDEKMDYFSKRLLDFIVFELDMKGHLKPPCQRQGFGNNFGNSNGNEKFWETFED